MGIYSNVPDWTEQDQEEVVKRECICGTLLEKGELVCSDCYYDMMREGEREI